MNRSRTRVLAIALILFLTLTAVPVRAQIVVFDPSGYAQAILQVEQLVRQYQFLIRQAKRLPIDIENRYHAHSIDWTYHDLEAGLVSARALLAALNEGDPSGRAYRDATNALDLPTDILGRMPADLRRRLTVAYSTIELADSMTRLAIDQTGAARVDGPFTLQAVRNVEKDIVNPADDFHSQTALLQKINAAFAINVRLGHQTNQFQLTALEQAIVENKRKRDTEALLVNATIHQWRYGQSYGEDMFKNTAARVDSWRPF